MTLLSKYESIRLKVGQDPMELKAEQDNIRDLLRSQGLLVEETMANTHFLRSLGPEYDVEVRNSMMQEDLSWIEIERAVRTRWETLKESAPRRRGAGQALMVKPGNWRNDGRRGTGRAGRERGRSRGLCRG
ncbi:unnamed protein product [Discosporangium mesarthrocarpum]